MFCLARFALHQLLPRRNSTRICWTASNTSTRPWWSTRRRKKRTPYRLLKVYFCCFIIICLFLLFIFAFFDKYLPAAVLQKHVFIFLSVGKKLTVYFHHSDVLLPLRDYILFARLLSLYVESRTSGSIEYINRFSNITSSFDFKTRVRFSQTIVILQSGSYVRDLCM